MKTAKQIIKNFNPKAVKFDGNTESAYSVLIVDQYSGLQLWVDVDVVDENIRADWNKIIFYLTDANDLLEREVQADCNVFDLATSEAIQFLEQINKVKENEDATWEYVN